MDASAYLSNAILTQEYRQVLELLDSTDQSLGKSLWGLEKRFFLLQALDGLERQKALLSEIRSAARSPIVDFMAFFFSLRSEESVAPDTFRNQLFDLFSDRNPDDPFRLYAFFRLCDLWDAPDLHKSAWILRMEQPSSVIDYYETFVRLGTSLLVAGSQPDAAVVNAMTTVAALIDDIRTRRVCALAAGRGNFPADQAPSAVQKTLNLWYAGRYEEAIEAGESPAARADTDALLATVFAEGEAGRASTAQPKSVLRSRLKHLLHTVAEKSANYDEAFTTVLRITQNLHDTHFAASVAHCARELMSPIPSQNDALEKRAAIERWSSATEADVVRADVPAQERASELSSLSSLELALEAAWNRSDYEAIIHELSAPVTPASNRHRHYVWRTVANALIAAHLLGRAVEYIVEKYILDSSSIQMLPITMCVVSLTDSDTAALSGNISLPILLELFSRHIEDRPTELRHAHEDFLTAHRLEKASQLSSLAMKFDRAHLVYYLRYVSVPRTIQLSFANSREVEQERVAICTFLKQLDPGQAGAYDAEIREITRRQSISQGLQQVEQSKIWIDQEPLKHWAEKHLQEDFNRYRALRAAGITRVGRHADSAKSSSSESPSGEVPAIPDDEVGALLMRIVRQFVYQCFMHKQHGLDSYLSLRIRHGALSGQLRAPLEGEKIVTLQREPGSGEYIPNRYWQERLATLDIEMALAVDARLRQFSKEFDALIEKFARDYVQIQSDLHPDGLFKAVLSPSEVMLAGLDVHPDTTFDSFIDLCVSVFWDGVDESLRSIREYIDGPLLRDMNAIFLSLVRDVEQITRHFSTSELDNAIRNAQTRARHALEQVKTWFQQPKPLQPSFMTFQSLVDIGLQAVKNMYHDFTPEVVYELDEELPLFFQLQKFTDIFMIVFDNIWRHCGVRSPRINVKASFERDYLNIEVVNELADDVINARNKERVEEIQKRILEGTYHRAVSSEGGTGLMKIRNIVGSDSGAVPKMLFGFRGSNQFYLQIYLPSTILEMVGRNSDENPDS